LARRTSIVLSAIAMIVLTLAALVPARATPQLLVDMRTGEVLYAKDAGDPWYPASLTKLMTAFVTFEAIARGEVNLDTPVIVSDYALEAPPSKVGFPVDTAVRLEDALYLLIVKSANDIAVAIAETIGGNEAAFVDRMNRAAAEMGLTATNFVNPHGLHDPRQTSSARDLAVLALTIRARYPQYDDMFATPSVRFGDIRMSSHNNLLTHFNGTTGMKTGYVCSAGLNIVATVERQGRALMAVVLGASSGRERGEMAAEMVLNGLSGKLRSNGQLITSVANRVGAEPVDMRPNLCGKKARDYVAARAAAFPYGLEGEPTYLTDDVRAEPRRVSTLGRIRDVPIPRPRPLWAPLRSVVADVPQSGPGIPLPRPRPVFRSSL